MAKSRTERDKANAKEYSRIRSNFMKQIRSMERRGYMVKGKNGEWQSIRSLIPEIPKNKTKKEISKLIKLKESLYKKAKIPYVEKGKSSREYERSEASRKGWVTRIENIKYKERLDSYMRQVERDRETVEWHEVDEDIENNLEDYQEYEEQLEESKIIFDLEEETNKIAESYGYEEPEIKIDYDYDIDENDDIADELLSILVNWSSQLENWFPLAYWTRAMVRTQRDIHNRALTILVPHRDKLSSGDYDEAYLRELANKLKANESDFSHYIELMLSRYNPTEDDTHLDIMASELAFGPVSLEQNAKLTAARELLGGWAA